jgi:transketolase
MGMAVGMAIAEEHFAAKFNKPGYPVFDHYTYVLGGDGCMMEGISSEAFSLAGTLGLSKLIVLYDSNKISIEGSTDIAFTENVQKRFESFGFQTLTVENGNDPEEIGNAIKAAQADKVRPSLITIKTKIGWGCPAKEGTAKAHGEPLGEENVAALKENLEWPSKEPFFVPDEVYDNYKKLVSDKKPAYDEWQKMFAEYCEKFPEMKEALDKEFDPSVAEALIDDEDYWKFEDKPQATRNLSGDVINKLKDRIPSLMGGSADLSPSTKTEMKGEPYFSKDNRLGRNMHFGIRELAMGAIGNGMMLSGLRAYVSTFFVFSDYLKPMARLAAIMKIPTIFVLTHDSIGVGEDGPTHEPIEQLAMFRAMPNFNVWRPADATETLASWYAAVTSKETPNAMVFTRQNLPQLKGSSKEALKGGYVLVDSDKETPDAIVIASGSEVQLGVEAKEALKAEGIDVRVVSMPCMDVFDAQSDEYKEKVLPKSVRARVGVEALSDFGWGKYIGLDGEMVSMHSFGASAPANLLFEKFGINTDAVVAAVKKTLGK